LKGLNKLFSSVGDASDFYLAGAWLDSRLVHQPSCLRFFMVFFSTSGQMLEEYFRPQLPPFKPFHIHHSPVVFPFGAIYFEMLPVPLTKP
jgi:hypothetical protein